MNDPTRDDLKTLLGDLASPCEKLTTRTLERLRPDLAARLAARTRPYVAIATCPLRARVYAEVEEGNAIELADFAGPDLPAELDAAVAAVLTCGLDHLPDATRAYVRAALQFGGRLALTVSPWPVCEATLILYVGRDARYVLGRLVLAEETAH